MEKRFLFLNSCCSCKTYLLQTVSTWPLALPVPLLLQHYHELPRVDGGLGTIWMGTWMRSSGHVTLSQWTRPITSTASDTSTSPQTPPPGFHHLVTKIKHTDMVTCFDINTLFLVGCCCCRCCYCCCCCCFIPLYFTRPTVTQRSNLCFHVVYDNSYSNMEGTQPGNRDVPFWTFLMKFNRLILLSHSSVRVACATKFGTLTNV